jgi:3-hydroxy-9,10-secoandrosta-1,3,5(10)-triene-9,17-dione monooxygenase reductase component
VGATIGNLDVVSSIDVARFKEVLGHFATGVAVVTAATPSGPVGFTCQSFGALSLEPMLVSFAAVTVSNSWPKARDVGIVGVNILSSEQEAIARVFGRSGDDKFAGIGWTPGPGGAPLLDDALAHVEGRIEYVTSQGDHDIVVMAAQYVLSHHGAPLVFFRGGFGSFD